IEEFIDRIVAYVPEWRKHIVRDRMRSGLVEPEKNDTDAIAKVWRDCAADAAKVSQPEYDQKHAALLTDLVCKATDNRKEIAAGIIRNWISNDAERRDFST